MMMKTTGSNGPSEKETGKDAYIHYSICVCAVYILCYGPRVISVWAGHVRLELDSSQQSSWIFNSLGKEKRTSISVIYDSENVQLFSSSSSSACVFLPLLDSVGLSALPLYIHINIPTRGINQNTILFITFFFLRHIIIWNRIGYT